jgi:peroxiredoxin
MKKLLIVFYLVTSFSIISFSQTGCFDCTQIGYYSVEQLINGEADSMQQIFIDSYIIGCQAPDFAACNMSGDSIIIHNLKNKVIVLDFWFMSCAPCINELPGLNKLAEEFKNQDVVFIAVSRDPKEGIKEYFLKNYKFNFIIIPDGREIAQNYCMPYFAWPCKFIINKDGKVRYFHRGGWAEKDKRYVVYDELKPEIEKCLNQ